jgi:hypothetical protein
MELDEDVDVPTTPLDHLEDIKLIRNIKESVEIFQRELIEPDLSYQDNGILVILVIDLNLFHCRVIEIFRFVKCDNEASCKLRQSLTSGKEPTFTLK